jgi:hypothetical protein
MDETWTWIAVEGADDLDNLICEMKRNGYTITGISVRISTREKQPTALPRKVWRCLPPLGKAPEAAPQDEGRQ